MEHLLKIDGYTPRFIDTIKEHKDEDPLIIAIKFKLKEDALKLLEKKDINCNVKGKCGNTPLILCLFNEFEDIALKLLTIPNIDYNAVNLAGDTALIISCVKRLVDIALILLDKYDINYNHKNDMGNTALSSLIFCSEKDIYCPTLVNNSDDDIYILGRCYIQKSNRYSFLKEKIENIILKLLERTEINYNITCNAGNNILLNACIFGMQNAAFKLLEK